MSLPFPVRLVAVRLTRCSRSGAELPYPRRPARLTRLWHEHELQGFKGLADTSCHVWALGLPSSTGVCHDAVPMGVEELGNAHAHVPNGLDGNCYFES
jgi:hypothetical protein